MGGRLGQFKSVLVVAVAIWCNIVNQGLMFGVVGVLVEHFHSEWSSENSETGWFGATTTGVALGSGK